MAYKNLKSPNGDKIQVESAIRDGAGKNIENNYAKQNGFYSGMGVGKAIIAEQIENISDERGETQDTPFISQGTGTANNTAVVDTPPVAKLLEKQGYTVANNRLAKELSSSNWTSRDYTRTSLSISDGIATVSLLAEVSDGVDGIRPTYTLQALKHRYLYKLTAKSNTVSSIKVAIINSSYLYVTTSTMSISSSYSTKYDFLNVTENNSNYNINNSFNIVFSTLEAQGASFDVKEFELFDLTQYFNGNDNIPADLLANPSHWSWYYNGTGAYDAGSLKNASGRYLVCTGRNLWDEEWEQGSIDGNGQNEASLERWRSKNYRLCVPNKPICIYYSAYSSSDPFRTVNIYFYDAQKNFISYRSANSTQFIVTAPEKSQFFKIRSGGISAETTYHNNVTISLYYSPEQGGEGYDQYYPYVEPKIYDTGTEELLAFDTKGPDGIWHKNTINADLSTLIWDSDTYSSLGIIRTSIDTGVANTIICSNSTYNIVNSTDVSLNEMSANDLRQTAGYIYIKTSGTPSGTVQYETTTPTTEQGTTYPEDIQDNDYGMMYWLDTDNNLVSTPQGCKLFYPADYVLWTDTAYARTGGDATKIALTEDISDTALAERGYIKTVDLSSYIFIDDTYLTTDYLYAYQQADVVHIKAKLTVLTVPAQGVEIMSIGEAITQGLNVVIVSSGTAKADIIEIDNGGEFDFTNTTVGDEVYIDGTVILG